MRYTTARRQALLILAILFGAATTAYSVLWMIHIRQVVGLGTDVRWLPNHEAELREVSSGSPAWQSGLRSGDRIVAVDGQRLDNPSPFYGHSFYKAIMLARKGDRVELSVLRPGINDELSLSPILAVYDSPSGLRGLALQVMSLYPLFFLIVGILVLALRLEDRNAWLLAILFAGFICGAPLFEGSINPHFRGLMGAYKTTFEYLVSGVFAYFFLTFPVSSPIDLRLPRLKVVLIVIGLGVAIFLGLACLLGGGLFPLYSMFGWISRKPPAWPLRLYTLALYGVGFVSLVWNGLRPATVEARRKTRVILWGILAGFGPLFVMFNASFLTNHPVW